MKKIIFEVIARLINVFKLKRDTHTSTLDYQTLQSISLKEKKNYFNIGIVIFTI